MSDVLVSTPAEGVLVVTIDRPQARNAVSASVAQGIAVRTLLASYRRIEDEQVGDADRVEAATARDRLAHALGPADVARRREAIVARGQDQNAPS